MNLFETRRNPHVTAVSFLGILLICLSSHAQPISYDTVKVENSSLTPYNSLCQLNIYRKGIRRFWILKYIKQSSGAFISPNIVLTSAHNTFSKFGTKVFDVFAYRGRNNAVFLEERSIRKRKNILTNVRVPDQYRFFHFPLDYSLIYFSEPLDNYEDTFQLAVCEKVASIGDTIYVGGYPGVTKNGRELYQSKGTISDISESLIKYDLWTEKGISGSPVYLFKDSKYFIIGIHAGVNNEGETIATKISQRVYEEIAKWRREFEGL